MKASPLEYARAVDLDHALTLLREGGADAKPIAGGQSLVASLNLRLVGNVRLVDINHVEELRGIEDLGDRLRIGALTRHCELEQSPLIAQWAPALKQAAPMIGHAAIRSRGTIGGSIAYADPAAELPACAVALNATIVLAGPEGERRVAAEAFFQGLFETDRKDGELVTAVEFPKIAENGRHVVLELARRSGDYALAGIVLSCELDGGSFTRCRIACFGVGEAPVLAQNAMQALVGRDGVEAACQGLDADLDPPDDATASGAYKKHVSRVLLRRALSGLVGSSAAA